MGYSFSEADSRSASKEANFFVWNPNVQHRVHEFPLLVTFLRHWNPVNVHTLCSWRINFNNIFLWFTTWSSAWSLPFRFPGNILCAVFASLNDSESPGYLTPLDSIALLPFAEEWKFITFPHYALFSRPLLLWVVTILLTFLLNIICYIRGTICSWLWLFLNYLLILF